MLLAGTVTYVKMVITGSIQDHSGQYMNHNCVNLSTIIYGLVDLNMIIIHIR